VGLGAKKWKMARHIFRSKREPKIGCGPRWDVSSQAGADNAWYYRRIGRPRILYRPFIYSGVGAVERILQERIGPRDQIDVVDLRARTWRFEVGDPRAFSRPALDPDLVIFPGNNGTRAPPAVTTYPRSVDTVIREQGIPGMRTGWEKPNWRNQWSRW